MNDRAYWLYVQAVFTGVRRFREVRGSAELTVRIPANQILDSAAVRLFRTYRQRIQDQTEGVLHHE